MSIIELQNQLNILKNDLHLLKIKKDDLLSISERSESLQKILNEVNFEISQLELRKEIIEIDIKVLYR